MLSSKYWITNCILLTILTLSAFTPTLVYAAPLANNDKDWQYVNGNSWGWNYSPETQISKSNVNNLEVKWVYPIALKSSAPASILALNAGDGSQTPPIVHNGKVYITNNAMTTIALDAKTGKQLWANTYSLDLQAAAKRLPLTLVAPHFHGIRYWEGGDAILYAGLTCDIYGINAATGKIKFDIIDLCKDIPGSIYTYRSTPSQITNIGTYEKGRQFIYNIGTTDVFVASGRAVTMGVSMDTNQTLWRVFNTPAEGVPTKDWALQECNVGYFLNTPCSEVAAKAPDNLLWDNAPGPDQPPSPGAGATQAWGQAVVDEDTGIYYMNTGNQLPWSNISQTIGPRLYGSAIMAIDMNAGKRIWWQQPQPRDPYDYDCNWNGMLINDAKLGKVYVKGCKEGHWIVSDAKTGKPVNIVDVFEEQYPGKRTAHITDPFSHYDMVEWKAPENSKYHGAPPVFYTPGAYHGTFATDQTYDPETGTVFHYVQLNIFGVTSTPIIPGTASGAKFAMPPGGNATIVARDLETGKVKWTYFYKYGDVRAHLVVTHDLLFTGFPDGKVRFFDKNTGQVLRELNLGSGLQVGLTTGQDSDGNQKIFTIVAGGAGTLVALGLSDNNNVAQGAQTTTVTTTSVTTSVTTTTSATTSTVTSTSATTSTSTSIITTTLAPQTQTTTVTTQAPAQTTTVTSSVTQTTETIGPITYAAVGVAVIALIAAAVMVMRKK